jgi:hypothetical protein
VLLSTQGASVIRDSQEWCRFNGIRGLSSALCEYDLQASARKSWLEKKSDRKSHEGHDVELGVDRLQLGLPAQEGDVNGAAREANHSENANANSGAQGEEHENLGSRGGSRR